MWHESQRFDYDSGILENPKGKIVRIHLKKDQGTWFDLFAELLEQPNVSEIEAFSVGNWSRYWVEDDPYHEMDLEKTDEDEDYEDYAEYAQQYMNLLHLDHVVEAIVAAREKLPNLKFVFLAEIDDVEQFVSYSGASVAALLNAFPKLETLYVRDQVDLRGAKSDSLKEFVFYSIDAYPEFFAQLQGVDFPNLTTLGIFIGTYELDDEDLASVYENTLFPKLKHLSINHDDNNVTSTDILKHLVNSPLLETLETLDLTGITLDDDAQFIDLYSSTKPACLKEIYFSLPYEFDKEIKQRLLAFFKTNGIEYAKNAPSSRKYLDSYRFAIARE